MTADAVSVTEVRNKNEIPNCPSLNNVVKLKREMGLLNAVAVSFGATIGSGIFIAPKGISSHVGSVGLSLVLWLRLVSGLISILGAFCYAELGTTFPTSGGGFTNILQAFGPLPAFLCVWSKTVLQVPGGGIVLVLTIAKYAIQPFFPSGCIPTLAVQLCGAVVLGLTTFVNCCGMKGTKKILNAFMFFKLGALACVIIGGIYALSQGKMENYEDIWKGSKFGAGTLVLASFSGSQAYAGWESMVYLMEELKNPDKNLPRGIFISLLSTTCIYLLANVSYFAVLSVDEILASDAVAVTFFDKIWGGVGSVVPIMVSLSILGTLTIRILHTSRLCFVTARNGQLPEYMSLITTEINYLSLPS